MDSIEKQVQDDLLDRLNWDYDFKDRMLQALLSHMDQYQLEDLAIQLDRVRLNKSEAYKANLQALKQDHVKKESDEWLE